MRALIKQRPASGLALTEIEIPEPGPSEVRIRIDSASICGTDLHIYNWDDWAASTVPVPMTIGHEFVGHIDKLGDGANGFEVGQRVSGEGHIVCGQCRNCRAGREHLCRDTKGIGVNRTGAFADYLVIPEHNVYPIPDDIADEYASVLDPLGNAVHTALSFDLVGEDVLITGAGPIGLMASAVCRHVGARHVVITDINPKRLELAELMGASRAVVAGQEELDDVMHELGMKEGFDVGLEMSGSAAALQEMIDNLNNGGQVGLLGIFHGAVTIDLNKAIFKGLQFKGIYGREMFDTWHKALAMLESGLDISPILTHRFAFEDFEEGFEVLNKGDASKVILDLHAKPGK
ncbi:L-threonine 3-dehydrogenase [Hoeflea prorocentri]|uniref:L-threonine 3-dehydrogenase n=1 Tax=Hoeflea prorocentri TaxID=1922333 RepID=A0A9X3UI22_9HYPH|nr:L-threonine 3-dehydrogenase [Hoeflea prorocentri]MCY6381052.1 L-threonine 3-dehydrogenase [Hoeflea prorocentri]MDA5398852.1 L-threonine 3-dehydrogenase [Hoeflea prorocentri]